MRKATERWAAFTELTSSVRKSVAACDWTHIEEILPAFIRQAEILYNETKGLAEGKSLYTRKEGTDD